MIVYFWKMMLLKKIFWTLWRVWFYFLMALPIIVLMPILIFLISFDRLYPYFFVVARLWANFILFGCGFYYRVKRLQDTENGKSYMFVGNHTSMADIMLMLAVVRNPFVFVGKKELANIPIFGFVYKKTCILVDRGSSKSRMEVFERAQKRLSQGLSICIFPEGGVPDDLSIVLDEFKDGAFRLAIEHQIPIVPIIFHDNKKRFSYNFFSGSPGLMRVTVLPFVLTSGMTLDDKKELRENVRTVMLEELMRK